MQTKLQLDQPSAKTLVHLVDTWAYVGSIYKVSNCGKREERESVLLLAVCCY